MRRLVQFIALAGIFAALVTVMPAAAETFSGSTLFIASAVEHPDDTATFPF